MMDVCRRLQALLDSKVPTGPGRDAKSHLNKIRGEIREKYKQQLGLQSWRWHDDLKRLQRDTVVTKRLLEQIKAQISFLEELQGEEQRNRWLDDRKRALRDAVFTERIREQIQAQISFLEELPGEEQRRILHSEEYDAYIESLEKEADERVAHKQLYALIRCLITVLILLCCLVTVASKKKSRLKYRYKNAAILILWQCGDVERNPGPLSNTLRDFCKKMISLFVKLYWESKEGRKLSHIDYKKKPDGWPKEGIEFADPSKLTDEKKRAMFECLYKLCLAQHIMVPNEWQTCIEDYQKLQTKQCRGEERKQLEERLQCWLSEHQARKHIDCLFDRLAGLPEPVVTRILDYFAERLKARKPELDQYLSVDISDDNELDKLLTAEFLQEHDPGSEASYE